MENRLSEFVELLWFDCKQGDDWFDFLRPYKQFIQIPIRKTMKAGYEGCKRLGDLAFPISMEQVELMGETGFSSISLLTYEFPLESFDAGTLKANDGVAYEISLTDIINQSSGLLRETLVLLRKAVRLAIKNESKVTVWF